MYDLRDVDGWFDMVLCEGHHPLVELPMELEVGWRNRGGV